MKLAALLMASAAALAQVKLPPAETVTLANGLRVILAPRQEIPMVTMQWTIRGGGESDPADQAGLSDLTGELLQRGAGSLDSAAFAARLDALGGPLTISADAQSTSIRYEFLARDAEAALALLADALVRPAFAEAEVKKALSESIDAVRSIKDEPGDAIRYYLSSMMFGKGHSYGRPVDELSLARIDRAAIHGYHRRYYVARNIVVAIAGSFEAAAMRRHMESAFADLPAGEAFAFTQTDPAPPTRPRLLLVDKPDAPQTYFRIAMPGIRRGDPDHAAIWLVNTLFGERFTSMLNDELRVNSGLTYGASSAVQQDRLNGMIQIASFTKSESTVAAIDLALTVLERLRKGGITAAQLASAKRYIKGTYPAENLETDAQVAAILARLDLFGLNKGEVDDLFSRLDAVTLAQANAVIRARFGGPNLQFCLVGNAKAIAKDVAKYAPAMKTIAITEPGLVVPEF